MIHSCFTTLHGNVHALIRDKVVELAKRDGIYELSYGYGFPFASVSFNSPVVNCRATSPELARSTARELAARIWQNRERFVCHPVTTANALKLALVELKKQGRIGPDEISRPLTIDESSAHLMNADEEMARTSGFLPDTKVKGPVVIAEKSDNPGEVGKVIEIGLGGKASKLSGASVEGKVYVKSISDGRYTIVSPMGKGVKFDTGPSVGLLIEGVDVTVFSGTMQALDAQQMKLNGFDPMDYRIIVVKSVNHFRAWWADVASLIIDCESPSIPTNDLTKFEFKKKTRKLFPLDKDAVYS